MKREPQFGVYQHAEMVMGIACVTGRGYVVRSLGCGLPYSRLTPVRTFVRRSDAQRCADRLTERESCRRHGGPIPCESCEEEWNEHQSNL